MRSQKLSPLARALQHQQAGETALAEALCQQIVRNEPYNAEAWNILGMIGFAAGNAEAALGHFERARLAAPKNAAYRSNCGAVLASLGRHAEAEREFREAMKLKPTQPEAHYNLGKALEELGRHAESEACYRRTLELKPTFHAAYNNLGASLQDQGRCAEAEACYRRALQVMPANPETHYNLARVLLLTGNHAAGWSEYEWRWQVPGFARPALLQPLLAGAPEWDGGSLEGRTILLYPEQGLGDTIQFVRYAALVQERGGRVLFFCPRPLQDVLRDVPGVGLLVPDDSIPPPFDVHASLMSLPRLCGTTVETIPAPVPYLTADATSVERWQNELASITGFKVGIVWQGNPKYPRDRQRSVPLTRFEPLAKVPGVSLLSLQVGTGHEQLAALEGRFPVLDVGARFDPSSLNDAVGVLQYLDLLISVDTALVHLAGALGVPVWLMLPFVPDFRWLLEREDSPWYPSVRLMRQRRPGDWDEVFTRIASALNEQLSRRSRNGGPAPAM